MARIRANSGSGGGASGSFTKTIEDLAPTTRASTVLTFNLSSVSNSDKYELFQNFFPYLSYEYMQGNGNAIDITHTYTYNAQTQTLTITLGGSTSYIHWNANGTFKLNAYASV